MQMNWLGVVIAIVAGMAVAGVWYGKLFVTTWWNLTGITPEQSKASSRRNMAQLLVANMVTAVGLAVAVEITFAASGVRSVWLAILVGAAAWLAFSATTLLQHNGFELKPPRLTMINSAYQLTLFLAMALAIGLF
jgi:fatty acid desaturase